MLARRIQLSLLFAQLAGAATLLRSIAYDRWITVLVALLLIAGATAAQRRRSWGIGLALAAACWFPMAWAVGIAPAWFCLVGLAGATPFALSAGAFARFDRKATALLAALAASLGIAGAVAWKHVAWTVFSAFPLLRPSLEANHGLALAAVLATTALAGRSLFRSELGMPGAARVRVADADRVRVELDAEREEGGAEDDAAEEMQTLRRAGR